MKPFLLYLVVVLFGNITVNGQDYYNKHLRFRFLTVENNLSSNRAISVSKSKCGYIWIGTDDGLNRFDGINCSNYYLITGNREFDKWNKQISGIFTDYSGKLWIGAFNLFFYNEFSDEFVPFFNQSDTSQPLRIRTFAQSSGLIWMGARQGLYSLNPNTKKLNFYPVNNLKNIEIWDICIKKNVIWLTTKQNGLFKFDILLKKFTPVTIQKNGKLVNTTLSVYCDNNNTLWIGTKDDGLFTLNTQNNKLTQHNLIPASSRIRKIYPDKNENLFIGTFDGLYFKSKNCNDIKLIALEDNTLSKLSQNSVHNIYIDNHDILWLSTFSGGVSYADLHQKNFNCYSPDIKKENSFNKNITCFAEDYNHNIYVASDSSGINVYNSENLFIKKIPMGNKKIIGKCIRCLAFDSNNNLWIGSYQGGITKYSVKNNTFKYYTDLQQNGSSLQSNSVYSIAIDKQNNIWVGTNLGVDRINDKTGTIDALYSNPGIHYVYIDRKNEIWSAVSDDGVFKYDPVSNKFLSFCEFYNLVSLTTVFRDSKNHLWVGETSGLVCIDLITHSMHKFTKENGLSNNTIQAILEDNNKNLWISTASGISKCENAVNHPEKFQIKCFYINDGLQSDYFNKNAAFKSSDGNLIYGGINGYNSFFPDSIIDDNHTPDIELCNLKISNTLIKPNSLFHGNIILNQTLSHTRCITLSHKDKFIYIDFIGLYYLNPEKIKYAYKLYPLETYWNYTTYPRNFASYYSLPKGEYKLMIKAANSDGVWDSKIIELNIKIDPPLWQKTWFIISSILVLLLILYLIYKNRINIIRLQTIKLELLVEERTREINVKNVDLEKQKAQILQQTEELSLQKKNLEELNSMKDKLFSIIAHDLKNPFNTLLGFSDILKLRYKDLPEEKKLKYIDLINTSAKKIFNLLENLLFWSRNQMKTVVYNPEPLNMQDVIIQNIKLLEVEYWKKGIKIENNLPSPLLVYGDMNMLNVIVRNILSNAIKFSYPNHSINIVCHENSLFAEIIIIDSGIGINEDKLENLFYFANREISVGTAGETGSGLGLVLCKSFIEEHGGKIWADSIPGKGSAFHFTIPVNKHQMNLN